MIPLFFGPSERQLYGVYHPPSSSQSVTCGVVLCYPFGQEYMRAHRAYRQLAMQLAKSGYHVLRFDYLGTGDSSKSIEEVTATDWVDDIGLAVKELRDQAGELHLSLVGLRLGALLAAHYAAQQQDVEKVVVWDAVNNADEYFQELQSLIDESDNVDDLDVDNFVADDGTMYFNGFPLTTKFIDSLKAIDLYSIKSPAKNSLQVVSHESTTHDKLKAAWHGADGYEYQLVPAAGDWNYVDDFGGILLPQPIIQYVVNWFSQQE